MEQQQSSGLAHGLRFILHVGDGKTGSSSIQETLRRHPQRLRERGYWYLGQMLELAPEHRYPWQEKGAAESFVRMHRDDAGPQLVEVLRDVLVAAAEQPLHTLVWSNEAFFGRAQNLYAGLEWLRGQGVQIEIVAYVRRHDAWLRSAYAQWGLRHKTYPGPVRRFGEWIRSRRPKQFAPAIEELDRHFPDCVRVRNLDAVGNSVNDFLAILGIPPDVLGEVRINETPAPAELLLRVLLNDRLEGPARGNRFDQLFGRGLAGAASPTEYLARLLPDEAALERVRKRAAQDRVALDRILAANGQPPVDTSPMPARPPVVDESALLLMLCGIVVRQALRIEALERRLGAKPEDSGSLSVESESG